MWRIFCAFLLVFLMAEASPGDYCIDVSDCDSGECCQILSAMQIASRKRGWGGNSTCQRYQRLGESCNPFDKWNGYCSCEPGTKCTYHPPLTSPHIVTPPPRTTPGFPETSPPPRPITPPDIPQTPGIPETSPPVPTTPSPSTPPPGSTTLVYPDTTTSSPDDPPCGRKKRALIAGATYDCQPI